MKFSPVALLLVGMSLPALAQTHIPENIKAHHKTLFSDYSYQGKNLADETRAGRDVNVTKQRFLDTILDPEGLKEFRQHPYPHLYLRGIACDADAVVVATPTYSETDVTQEGDSLFTDYRFKVESVLKNTSGDQLENAQIIVTRPGGHTVMNGHSVTVQVADFPLFEISHRYLLFLEYLRTTETFEAFGIGSFELTNSRVVPFDADMFSSIGSIKDENAFLTEVRAAITAPCAHQGYPNLGKRPEGL